MTFKKKSPIDKSVYQSQHFLLFILFYSSKWQNHFQIYLKLVRCIKSKNISEKNRIRAHSTCPRNGRKQWIRKHLHIQLFISIAIKRAREKNRKSRDGLLSSLTYSIQSEVNKKLINEITKELKFNLPIQTTTDIISSGSNVSKSQNVLVQSEMHTLTHTYGLRSKKEILKIISTKRAWQKYSEQKKVYEIKCSNIVMLQKVNFAHTHTHIPEDYQEITFYNFSNKSLSVFTSRV